MASLFVPTQCGTLHAGDHMLINDRPCKIVDVNTSKTGKHGAAKAHFIAIDIFTNKKYTYLETTTKNINVPIVTKTDYQLIGIDDDSVSYLDEKGIIMDDLYMPDFCDSNYELGKQLQIALDEQNSKEKESDKNIYITVVSSMNISAIKEFKIK